MKKINAAIVGLGRLGFQHAEDLMFQIPGANLIAACSIVPDELKKVEPWGIKTYSDYDTMLKECTDIDAVFIASSTAQHAEQIIKGIESGKHVFCEKPLGLNVQECEKVLACCEKHPENLFQLGFMRRYDPSYAAAKRMVDAGEIGRPIMVKAASADPISEIESFLRFAPTSGGQFLDLAVHDIDLAMWFIGDDVETIYAVGDAYLYPELKEYKDGDNTASLMRFKKGAVAFLHAGRLSPNGYQVEMEIVGTKQTLRISAVPRRDRIEIYNSDGVVVECCKNFNERFKEAYLLEKRDFIDCIIENRTPGCGALDGLRAVKVAFAATEAYQSGELVHLN